MHLRVGFYKRAKAFPLQHIIYLLDEGHRVTITGFSQGAAVAELVTVRLLRSPRFRPQWVREDRILYVGFGCPVIGDLEFSKSLRKWDRIFHHFQNEHDIVPKLLPFAKSIANNTFRLLLSFLTENAKVPRNATQFLASVPVSLILLPPRIAFLFEFLGYFASSSNVSPLPMPFSFS